MAVQDEVCLIVSANYWSLRSSGDGYVTGYLDRLVRHGGAILMLLSAAAVQEEVP